MDKTETAEDLLEIYEVHTGLALDAIRDSAPELGLVAESAARFMKHAIAYKMVVIIKQHCR